MSGFQFSQDSYWRNFGFKEFIKTANELKQVADPLKSHINPCVLTYDKKTLEQIEEYRFVDFDEKIWNNSYLLEFFMSISDKEDDFMVKLVHDKEEEHRLFFYGRGLEKDTQEIMIRRFKKIGRWWLIGDGKPSGLTRKFIEERPLSKVSV